MSSLLIPSTRYGRRISFSDYDGDYVFIEVGDDTVRACKKIYLYSDGHMLCKLFRDMASDWRGWAGEKRFESVEGDLQIEAKSDGKGHVELRVTVKNYSPEDSWSLSIPIWLEAGSLDDMANKTNEYFGCDKR